MLILLFFILYVAITFFWFIFIKYTAKVAQANILPITNDAVPFDDAEYTYEPNRILIPIGKDQNGKMWTREIEFPLEENLQHQKESFGFLYEQMHTKKTASNSMLYFYMMAQGLLTTDFYIINKIYQFINAYFYDFVLLLIGTHLLPIIFHIILFVNVFYFIFLWFYNLCYFWYEKEDDPADETRVRYIPKPVRILIWKGSIFTLIEMWLLILLLLILGIIIVPLVAVFFAAYTFFYPVSMSCVTKHDNKLYGMWAMAKDFLIYNNATMAWYVSFLMLAAIHTHLGVQMALIFLIAAFCLYMMTKAYQNNIIKDTTGFDIEEANYKQTIRILPVIAIPFSENSGSDVAEKDVAEKDVAEKDVAEKDVAEKDVAEKGAAEKDKL